MSTKTVEHALVKAIATAVGQHEIEFYAIAFSSEPDNQGDIIDSGAADEWLATFYAKGKPLPISFRHAAMLGESRSDPFSVIGWAPADPMHVWKDEHGVRVRAYLETEINDKAAQVYRLAKQGILTGASAVFAVHHDDEEHASDGSTVIKRIAEMKEAGLCLDPANEDAYLVAVKADIDSTENSATPATVDLAKAWDGAAAMRSCSSAADFRAIAFELSNDSEPDTAAHWALPHHNSPGAGANPDGVSAALGRLNQTGTTVLSKDSIRGHLEGHQPSERAAELDPELLELVAKAGTVVKAGRKISAKNANLIRTALAMLEELLSLAAVEEEVAEETKAKADESEPRADSPPLNADVFDAIASVEELLVPPEEVIIPA
jgi:HK97 family phage prohead protease